MKPDDVMQRANDIYLARMKTNLIDQIRACISFGEILRVIRGAERAITTVEKEVRE